MTRMRPRPDYETATRSQPVAPVGRRFAGIKSEKAFFDEIRESLDRLGKGSPLPCEPSVSFESLSAFVRALSPQKAAVVDMVVEQGSFPSIKALAAALRRDSSAVGRDVRDLADIGLVQAIKAAPAAGGRVCIRPAQVRIELELGARLMSP